MYNTINPINIVYRKPQDAKSTWRKQEAENNNFEKSSNGQIEASQNALEGQKNGATTEIQNEKRTEILSNRPNNTVNISQVINDFRSTVIAINAPSELSDEINVYLNLVEKEAKKENPAKDIVLSNLKNASRISDRFIADTLKKPSRVVEGWIDAIFMQNVDLHADENYINDIFKIKFPEKTQKKVDEAKKNDENLKNASNTENIGQNVENNQEIEQKKTENASMASEKFERNQIENSKKYYEDTLVELKQIFLQAKKLSKTEPVQALKLYDEVLDLSKEKQQDNLSAAIHFERGKILDNYDYVNLALNEYNEATETSKDNNLKSHAHLKMAEIYDEYVKYDPAIEHYHKAIAFSGEANNTKGQTRAMNELSSLFAKTYDIEKTHVFNDLTLDCAKECEDTSLLGKTYTKVAKNYEYVGDDKSALYSYKMAAKSLNNTQNLGENGEKLNSENYKELSKNYYEASKLMRKLGNDSKANNLLSKARQYENLGKM